LFGTDGVSGKKAVVASIVIETGGKIWHVAGVRYGIFRHQVAGRAL